MELICLLAGLGAGLLLGRGSRMEGAARRRFGPGDEMEEQWRALFAYEGRASRDRGEGRV